MAQTRKMQQAKPREGERDLLIEVLIGGECYWRIVKDASTIRLSSTLFYPYNVRIDFDWVSKEYYC
jgi:hypothetical protein